MNRENSLKTADEASHTRSRGLSCPVGDCLFPSMGRHRHGLRASLGGPGEGGQAGSGPGSEALNVSSAGPQWREKGPLSVSMWVRGHFT